MEGVETGGKVIRSCWGGRAYGVEVGLWDGGGSGPWVGAGMGWAVRGGGGSVRWG